MDADRAPPASAPAAPAMAPPRLDARGTGLQARIMALALLPVLILALLLGSTMIRQRNQDLELELQQRGQLLARQLAAAADYGLFSGNQAALQALTQAVSHEPSVVGATIADGTGRVMAISGSAPRVGTAPSPLGDLSRMITPGATSSHLVIGPWLAFIEPVRATPLVIDDFTEASSGQAAARPAAATAAPSGLAIVEMSAERIRQEQTRFAVTVVALLLLVLAGAFWVARLVSARIARPVLEVASAVQRIGLGVEGVRVRPSRIRVLNLLAEGFNETADQLERSRRELEQRVAQATAQLVEKKEQAEQADRSKTRFLAAASHDLRQPMHALSMFVSALGQEPSEAERQQLLRQVSSATMAMGNLLDALLDISKLDAGGVQAKISSFPLQQVLDRLRETFTELAERKGLELIIRNSREWVTSDPILLERILGNLVSNAIRYTPGGLHAGKVLVACRHRGDRLAVQVRDNGVGIAPESQEAIFQEFVQLSNPERDRSKGLGLGLAIVKRLAGLLGHPLGLRSLPGRGSTFSIDVPRAVAAPEPAPVSDAGHEAGAGPGLDQLKVLVIDDDSLVRESISRLLQLWGTEVESSAGGAGLPQELKARGWQPHIVLCDYRLADGLDGVTLVQSLRQAFGVRLPAAIITGDTELQSLRDLGDEDIVLLYKPVRPVQLRNLVKTLRGSAQAQVPAP